MQWPPGPYRSRASRASSVGRTDPQLADALAHTADGRITQYMAGVPALLERYRTAPPAARAVISAAMDASRLGGATLMARELLQAAREGYLSDDAYDALGEDWLRDAFAYTRSSRARACGAYSARCGPAQVRTGRAG